MADPVLLTAAQIVKTGIDVAGVEPSVDGNTFANTGKEFIQIKNGSLASVTVTIVTPATLQGQAVADRTVTVGAGITKAIGPFSKGVYNDADGLVKVTCSAQTDVTIKVLKS